MRARTPTVLAPLAVFALLAAAPPVVSAPAPKYYETQLIVDTEGDYVTNGALDIAAVYVSERYVYNDTDKSGKDVVHFRVNVTKLDDIGLLATPNIGGIAPAPIPGEPVDVRVEYIVNYTLFNIINYTFNATVKVTCTFSTGGSVRECTDPTANAPNFVPSDKSGVIIVVDPARVFLRPGINITKPFAVSALLNVNNTKTYQDLAPKDNQNVPTGATVAPEAFGSDYTLRGTYPFLTASLTGPASQFAVAGGKATFAAVLNVDANLTGADSIAVNFLGAPAGWDVSTTLGEKFDLTGGGRQIAYEFEVMAPTTAKEGDRATLVLDAVLLVAGGHARLTTITVVSPPRVDLPAYAFELQPPPALKEKKQATLAVKILKDGLPFERAGTGADFLLGGQKVGSAEGNYTKDGLYEFGFTFPKKGNWTMDAYVSELKPSPHKSFFLDVKENKKFLPAFEAAFAAAALATAVSLRRSRP